MSVIEPKTHTEIDYGLCGEPIELVEGRAAVRMRASEVMAVDERGLVHGGFVFGAADHAAMLAVDDPNVVLGASESRFRAPVEVGDEVIARAEVVERDGKKCRVEVAATVGSREVFSGVFTAFVLDQHVLDG
jgi:acyl-coenzyme A thioesterase PaaI-like protein